MSKSKLTLGKQLKDFFFAYGILLKNKRKDTIIYTLCTVLSGIASIVFDVFFIAIILDMLIKGAAWEEICIACISGIVLVLFRVVLSKLAAQLSSKIYTINKNLMNIEVFKKSLDYSLKEYSNPEFFDAYKLVVDSGADYINKSLDMMTSFLQSLFLCAVFFTEFFRHNIVLVLIITAALIIHFIFWNIILKKQADVFYNNKKELQQYERSCQYYERQFYLRESALDLKNTTLFEYMSTKYNGSLMSLMNAQRNANKKSFVVELLNPLWNNSFQSIVELVIILVMFNMGLKDIAVYWELIALFGKLTSFYFFNCMGDLTTVSNFVGSYKEFFNHPTREKFRIDSIHEAPYLEIHDVCFSYKQNDPFKLKKINICVSPGESIAIVGRNGSGKTTLMNLLLGVYTPDSGYVSIKTANNCEVNLADSFPNMIMQEFNIYYTTVRNNITMGVQNYSDEDILNALQKAECDFLNIYDHPLDTEIGKEINTNAIELSGGQSQRIALARCFLSQIPFVLLDEPTASVDSIFEKPLIDHLLETISNKTTVIITHRLDITEFVDTIYVMEDGEIIESGKFNELMRRRSVFKDMYESQKGI